MPRRKLTKLDLYPKRKGRHFFKLTPIYLKYPVTQYQKHLVEKLPLVDSIYKAYWWMRGFRARLLGRHQNKLPWNCKVDKEIQELWYGGYKTAPRIGVLRTGSDGPDYEMLKKKYSKMRRKARLKAKEKKES